MLPYFRGMEAFSISLPKSWSELSDQQLLFFSDKSHAICQ